MKINKVMSTVGYDKEHLEMLKEVFSGSEFIIVDKSDNAAVIEAAKTCDVAILGEDLDDRYINNTQLKWIHCDHAGLNKSATREVLESGIIVTSSAGRSAPALAEHIILFMLALCYRFDRFLDAQRQHKWGIQGQSDLRGLSGRTLGILGLGNTGRELAVRAKAMDMRILGYGSSEEKPQNIDVYYRRDRDTIRPILAECDFLALCLPLTDETYHMISENEFKLMKNSAYIINMARGPVIDTKALIDAVKSGEIAGAGLDTFDHEPLEENSELWDLENVFITPHSTPQVPDRTGNSIKIIAENALRYREGEPMLNQLKEHHIYTK